MSKQGPKSKYWVFTINNPNDDQVPCTWEPLEYGVWQKEKGESGTVHLQGYCCFNKQLFLTAVKKLHSGAHWEVRKGTHVQAKEYCQKAESRVDGPWEFGEENEALRKQGARADLLALKRKLDDGATEKELMESDGFFPVLAKYPKLVQRYKRVCGGQRSWATRVLVLWGPTGTGKSTLATQIAGPDAFWLSKPAGQTTWWDDYDGQEVVVIDDFYSWIPFDMMLRLCDRYPLNVETKGGSTPFKAKLIILTSNASPYEWYAKVTDRSAWFRRLQEFGQVEHVTPDRQRLERVVHNFTEPFGEALLQRYNVSWLGIENQLRRAALDCDEVLPPTPLVRPEVDGQEHAESYDEGCEQFFAEAQPSNEMDRWYLTTSGEHWVPL